MSDTPASAVGPVAGAGGERPEPVEQTVAALDDHDAAGFAAAYSPGSVVRAAASPEPLRGRAAIQQDTQQWITAMPDTTMAQQLGLV